MVTLNVNSGDDISAELDNNLSDGATVTIPSGSYDLSDIQALAVSATSDTLVEGDGLVTLDLVGQDLNSNRVDHDADGATLTFRNIELVGNVTGKGGFYPGIFNGGELRYENFHFRPSPDSSTNTIGWLTNQFDDANASGTFYFHDSSVENMTNNGLYSSHGGAGSSVNLDVKRSFFAHNNVDQIRCGNDGDVIEDSVFVMHQSPPSGSIGGSTGRSIRMDAAGSVAIRNCDFIHDFSGASSPIVTTTEADSGSIELTDLRVLSDHPYQYNNDAAIRSNGSGPSTVTGSGCHMTGANTETHSQFDSVVACRGSSCDAPTETVPESPSGGTWSGHNFALITETAGDLDYTLTVTDGVRRVTDNDYPAETNNDSITDNGDGTYTVDGFTANAGYGDTYEIRGSVTDVVINTPEQDRAEFRLERNGTDVTNEYFGPEPVTYPEVDLTFDEHGVNEVVVDGTSVWSRSS